MSDELVISGDLIKEMVLEAERGTYEFENGGQWYLAIFVAELPKDNSDNDKFIYRSGIIYLSEFDKYFPVTIQGSGSYFTEWHWESYDTRFSKSWGKDLWEIAPLLLEIDVNESLNSIMQNTAKKVLEIQNFVWKELDIID